MREIAICMREINVDVDTVFTEHTLHDDEELINAIVRYAENIKNDGGEIFKHEKNIIATSEGYFFAFYTDELHK